MEYGCLLRNLIAIIFSSKFSVLSPPSSSRAPLMWMLIYLMLFHKSLKLPSLFVIPALFVALIMWGLLSCLWVCWSFLLLHLVSFKPLYCIFSVQLLYSSALWFSLILLNIFSLLKFSLCPSSLLPSSGSILWSLFWTLSEKLFISFSFRSFMRFYLVLLSCLEHIPLFLHSLRLFVSVSMHEIKKPLLSVLKEWTCAGDETFLLLCPNYWSSFKPLCLSKQPNIFLIAPDSWKCAKTSHCPKVDFIT